MSDFDIYTESPLLAQADQILLEIESELEPNWGNAPVQEEWLQGFIYEKSGGKPTWKPSYQCNHVEGRSHRGAVEFEKGGYVFGPTVRMKPKMYGREASIDDLALVDFEGWSGAPAEIDDAISKERARIFARLLNYGHLITDWTGTYFFKDSTGAKKPSNPMKSKLGTWHNALPSESATPRAERMKKQIKLLRKVKGLDGEYLGLGEMDLHIWSPTEHIEEDVDLLNKLVLVPGTDGTSSGGGNTSKVWNRAVPHEVRGLRSDMLIVAAIPPSKKLQPFIHRRGEQIGSATPNEDPNRAGAGLPEFEVFVWDRDSDMYKKEGKLGFAKKHRRGYSLRSPHCLNVSYDGLANATVDGVSYAALPTSFY
jgi:hypothetical protein